MTRRHATPRTIDYLEARRNGQPEYPTLHMRIGYLAAAVVVSLMFWAFVVLLILWGTS